VISAFEGVTRLTPWCPGKALVICEEFDQASLVNKLEAERMVGEFEMVVKLIQGF
jgi:hypothetical protein